MSLLKSQILGLLLGLATAVGCIFYEKIVNNFSYSMFIIIWFIESIILFTIAYFVFPHDLPKEFNKLFSDNKYIWWAIIYILTAVTGPLWYYITNKQGVMATSIYEVKYIVMLAVLYWIFGAKQFNWNTIIGMVLALCSIYFVSKS